MPDKLAYNSCQIPTRKPSKKRKLKSNGDQLKTIQLVSKAEKTFKTILKSQSTKGISLINSELLLQFSRQFDDLVS